MGEERGRKQHGIGNKAEFAPAVFEKTSVCHQKGCASSAPWFDVSVGRVRSCGELPYLRDQISEI